MNRAYIIVLILGVFMLHPLQSQTIDIGDIPQSRIAVDGWKDIKFDGSGNWTTVDVTTQGVTPNTGADMAPAIEQMIMNGSDKTIYEFPAGNYNINSDITIRRGDFQFIGVGKDTKFFFRGGDNAPTFRVQGGHNTDLTLAKSVKRGDNKMTLTSTSGLSVGDYIYLAQVFGDRDFDTDNQIVKVIAKNDNDITVDMKIGLDFDKDKATIRIGVMRQNIKFSNFYMERTSEPTNRVGQIRFSWVQNAEVSNIESKKVLISHLTFSNCRDVLVFKNNLYGNFGYKTRGGYNYGVTANFCTRINIINNRMSNLRHHIALQFGSDHCVIAYNRTTVYNHYADYGQHNSKGCHNNLFEGNYGEELFDDNNKKAWGTRYTIWFRNHALQKLGSEYPSVKDHAIIGNEIRVGESGLKGKGVNNVMVGGNIVNIDGEYGYGDLLWGDLPTNATLPNSLFLTEKPDYLDEWPLYGPNASARPEKLTLSIGGSNQSNFTLDEGYRLHVEAEVADPSVIDNVKLYVDNDLIRQESAAPYEWGHAGSPDSDEINGLVPGTYTFKVVATNNSGATQEASIQVQVVDEQAGPSGYTFASNENQTVNVSGTKDIAYGANGQFNYLHNQTSNVGCNNDVFGDPIPGVAKKCYIRESADYTPPSGFTLAANYNETVQVTSTMDVAYGANGSFVYLRDQTSDVSCDNDAFGSDPTPGYIKKCYTMPVDNGPAGYTFAVNENQTVNVSGTMDIAYGANGSYNYLYDQSSNVTCDNTTFGDPIPGVAKKCYVRTSIPITIESVDEEQSPNDATNMLDGDNSDASRWSAKFFSKSVVFDLGSSRQITGTKIWTYSDRAYQYRVQVSDSPSSGFSTVSDQTGNTSTAQPHNANFSATGRYVKLTVTGASGYSGDWVSITEFEIQLNASRYSGDWVSITEFEIQLSASGRVANDPVVQEDLTPAFKVYPNPATDQFSIDIQGMGASDVYIYDMNGAVLFSDHISKEKLTLSKGSTFRTGLYLIKVISEDNQIHTQKLMLK